jgi:sigma54-dependent transcription regulator
MKIKNLKIIFGLIVFLLFASSCETMTHMQMANERFAQSHNERYGSGTLTDMSKSENFPELAHYYSRINKLYDDGEITKEERDKRKVRLNNAYKEREKSLISLIEYERIREECINK